MLQISYLRETEGNKYKNTIRKYMLLKSTFCEIQRINRTRKNFVCNFERSFEVVIPGTPHKKLLFSHAKLGFFPKNWRTHTKRTPIFFLVQSHKL